MRLAKSLYCNVLNMISVYCTNIVFRLAFKRLLFDKLYLGRLVGESDLLNNCLLTNNQKFLVSRYHNKLITSPGEQISCMRRKGWIHPYECLRSWKKNSPSRHTNFCDHRDPNNETVIPTTMGTVWNWWKPTKLKVSSLLLWSISFDRFVRVALLDQLKHECMTRTRRSQWNRTDEIKRLTQLCTQPFIQNPRPSIVFTRKSRVNYWTVFKTNYALRINWHTAGKADQFISKKMFYCIPISW